MGDIRRANPIGQIILGIALLYFAFAAFMFALLFGKFGLEYWSLSEQGKQEVQILTLAELAKNGPGDNIHVQLQDFAYGLHYDVSVNASDNRWTFVYIPLLPKGKDAKNLQKGDIKVIVLSEYLRSEKDVDQFVTNPTVQGIISEETLAPITRKWLREAYPGQDVEKVYFLKDRKPVPTTSWVVAMFSGGACMLVAGSVIGGLGVFILRRVYINRKQPANRFPHDQIVILDENGNPAFPIS